MNGQVVTFKACTGEGEPALRLDHECLHRYPPLSKAIGQELDHQYVEIDHPIKTLGQHMVTVKIATGLTARVTVVVERVVGAGVGLMAVRARRFLFGETAALCYDQA